MNIKPAQLFPLKGKLLVEVISGDYQTESGLHVVTAKHETPHKCKVIALGKEFKKKYSAKEGDKVFIKRHSGQEVLLNFKKYLIINNDEIVGLL